jgi:hypothetical protein
MTEQSELDAIARADMLIDAELGAELLDELDAENEFKDYRLAPDFDEDSESEAERVCIERY